MAQRNVIVTGAGRGTGQAAALALGQPGARVAVVDINPDAAQRTADRIAARGADGAAHVVDVCNKMAVQTLLYGLLETWGGRIDVLVNAAQVIPGSPALRLDEWEWNRTVDVNLKGAFLMAQTVARAMKETGGGLIVNVLRPPEATPHAAARAARAGLASLTGLLAAEWGDFGVRVVGVPVQPDPEQTAAEIVKLLD